MENSIQVDALTDLLIELTIIAEQEFHSKLQEVQSDQLENERAV
jgi:hypothetical protein